MVLPVLRLPKQGIFTASWGPGCGLHPGAPGPVGSPALWPCPVGTQGGEQPLGEPRPPPLLLWLRCSAGSGSERSAWTQPPQFNTGVRPSQNSEWVRWPLPSWAHVLQGGHSPHGAAGSAVGTCGTGVGGRPGRSQASRCPGRAGRALRGVCPGVHSHWSRLGVPVAP